MNFKGNLSLYHPKGKYQFIINSFEKNKPGDIWTTYLKLKKKLLKEGLFSNENKKSIPRYPFKIGIISSDKGAVIHDMTKVINRRTPHIQIFFKNSKIQGKDAINDIIQSIEYFNTINFIDLIIIARGGGSFEDLDCFNSEKLARVIFNSKKPIISAIGHETDFTITDYVSDLRASTPSVAAEIISKSTNDILLEISNCQNILDDSMQTSLKFYKNELNHFKNRLSYDYFLQYLNRLIESKKNLDYIMHNQINHKMNYFSDHLSQYIKRLSNNNLKTILNKGFSLIKNKRGDIVSSLKRVSINEKLFVQFKDGRIGVKVVEKK